MSHIVMDYSSVQWDAEGFVRSGDIFAEGSVRQDAHIWFWFILELVVFSWRGKRQARLSKASRQPLDRIPAWGTYKRSYLNPALEWGFRAPWLL